jgi:hypothetical protein
MTTCAHSVAATATSTGPATADSLTQTADAIIVSAVSSAGHTPLRRRAPSR